MEALGPWHILIVAAVFVVLFGAKRLPDAARSLGKSARILKSELKDVHDSPGATAPTVPPAAPATPPVAPEPVVPQVVPTTSTVPPPPVVQLNGNAESLR